MFELILNIEKSFNWAQPTGRGPKWASTGATGARPLPPQSRSPSGDRAHGREGAGHRRSLSTHVPWRPYPFTHGRRGESSTSISPPRTCHCMCCSAPLSSAHPSACRHRLMPGSSIAARSGQEIRCIAHRLWHLVVAQAAGHIAG
jgi:hypothetical protein